MPLNGEAACGKGTQPRVEYLYPDWVGGRIRPGSLPQGIPEPYKSGYPGTGIADSMNSMMVTSWWEIANHLACWKLSSPAWPPISTQPCQFQSSQGGLRRLKYEKREGLAFPWYILQKCPTGKQGNGIRQVSRGNLGNNIACPFIPPWGLATRIFINPCYQEEISTEHSLFISQQNFFPSRQGY